VPSRRTIVSTVFGRAPRRVDAGGAQGPTADRPVSWSARSCAACRRAESLSAARRRFSRSSSSNAGRPRRPLNQVHNVFNTTAAFAAVNVAAPTNLVCEFGTNRGLQQRAEFCQVVPPHAAAADDS
jgi:hypothetical protein